MSTPELTLVRITMEELELKRRDAFSRMEVEAIDKELHRLKALEKKLNEV